MLNILIQTNKRKMLGLALHNNTSNCIVLNCIVLKLHWIMVCLVLGRAMAQQPNRSTGLLNNSMFNTCQQITYSLRPRTACWTESWYQPVVVTSVEKVSRWSRNASPVTSLQDGNHGDTQCKPEDTTAPQRFSRNICSPVILKILLP